MDGTPILGITARRTICLRKAQEGGPVKPGVTARVIARYRSKRSSGPITPGFIGAMAMFFVYRPRLSIGPFARPIVPSLKDRDKWLETSGRPRASAAADARTDDLNVGTDG